MAGNSLDGGDFAPWTSVEVEVESVAYLLCDRVGVDSQQYTVPSSPVGLVRRM